MGIEQLADLSPEIMDVQLEEQAELIEMDTGSEAELIEVEGRVGNSLFQMHQNFLIVSGGTPSGFLRADAVFDGGTPGSVFSVSPGFKNSIGKQVGTPAKIASLQYGGEFMGLGEFVEELIRTSVLSNESITISEDIGCLIDMPPFSLTQDISCEDSLTLEKKSILIETFTDVGTHEWVVPDGVTSVDVLVVVGGGGPGHSEDGSGGGGAGGLVLQKNRSVTPGESISLYVGDGGQSTDTNGEDSTFDNLTAKGGGHGGGHGNLGNDGGSGGGPGQHDGNGSTASSATQPGTNSTFYDEGSDSGAGHDDNGAGGGGAAQAGLDGGDNEGDCNGGDGIDLSSYFGTDVGENGYFAGGGAGGNNAGGGNGNDNFGGLGGGGDSPGSDVPQDGMANTGGGGGGRSANGVSAYAGKGGSGIVIIKYMQII